ncbi:drug resistance transporter, EmrB/QacA subfamily [Jatrophihabitans endophyticus]|uniref:Drug resistance transporter, EmrB/QacA subfamily n=1 Tax=Jatrophihabitans endophyticus TaxID=1206085 RepID=A0A1M5REU9_9ACTN|nr:MFS transporter [Jatrophihabitans endophyticus]SHH24791.1 drug resistance transporter, EmrB/QacA subfamily [Jatrophihabitans endophyticus]
MTATTDPTTSPERSAAPARVLGLCCGATFIAFLDLSVVNIAFPAILDDFPGTAIDTLTWIVSGYTVLFAALLTPAGRIADVLGRREAFLVSLVGFTVASLGCGAAPSVGWLIAARLVQGAMAAGMIPAALGLILATTPRERIPRAVAAWSAAAGFSAVIGPAVGGALLEVFGWRAVFFVNGPFGVLLFVAGIATLPARTGRGTRRLPDPLGTVALAVGVAALVTGLTEGDRWGWGDPRTVGLLVLGVVLVVATWFRSRGHAAPAVDVTVWRDRRYPFANAGLGVLSVAMFAWMLGGPLFTTSIWGWSTMQTAGALSIGAVASMIASLLAGRIAAPRSQVAVAVLGCLGFAGSNAIWASSLFGPDSDFWGGWVPAALLGGGGLGLALTCLSAVAAATVPPQKFAVGIGMTLTTRQLGGAIGAAGLAAIISSSAVPGSVASFHRVYASAAIVSVVAAAVVVGLALAVRRTAAAATPAAGSPSPAPSPAVSPAAGRSVGVSE